MYFLKLSRGPLHSLGVRFVVFFDKSKALNYIGDRELNTELLTFNRFLQQCVYKKGV